MTGNDKESVRLFHTLRQWLILNGYTSTANNTDLVWSYVDYIMLAPENYTIFEWLKDTKENYPEELFCDDEDEYEEDDDDDQLY